MIQREWGEGIEFTSPIFPMALCEYQWGFIDISEKLEKEALSAKL
jgi:hypothetical protein